MSRLVNRAENWEKAYEAFQQVNFSAWDFDSIKESLVDYLKLYYPESFNDFIESSELIALVELFAYVGTQLAYRFDLNAHENFISTAQRKESVLRLARFLSYNANRNLPARGLVKLTSISTSERIFDSEGNDLSNTTIRWNDPNNSSWKEQFILVMNRVLDQDFGTVLPSDRLQIQDILFERYRFNNNPITRNVLDYSISVSNEQFPMELVSSEITEFGPIETRPEKNLQLGVLYLNDGLGDSSNNTGFFMFTKQGDIQRTTATFDGITPNQTLTIDIPNSNEIDIWLNNIDPETGEILTSDDVNVDNDKREGVWDQVSTTGGRNVLFNTGENRNKFEVETLSDDRFRIIFGDGNFTNIPSGTFEIWSRISANQDLVIPVNAIQNVSNSFTYKDADGKEQSFILNVSLQTPIQNAAPSEDIERIRRVAPSVYYTQDRMVNGRDYNEFFLQDNSILKLRAINRTFAGDSRYLGWHDPSGRYEDVKLFGQDGVVYFNTETECEAIAGSDLPDEDPPSNRDLVEALIENHIQPLLATPAFFTRQVIEGISPSQIRIEFNSAERTSLESALTFAVANKPATIYLDFDGGGNEWSVLLVEPSEFWISVEARADDDWEICYNTKRIVFHSDETRFWNTNEGQTVLTEDTLNANLDRITVLRANEGSSGLLLSQNYNFDVISQVKIDKGEDKGLDSINDLYILPDDTDQDGFPDEPNLTYLIAPTDFVYFKRDSVDSPWEFQSETSEVVNNWANDTQNLWKRESGIECVNFAWFHRTPRYHLVDPAPSNIIDMYIITRGYNNTIQLWLQNKMANRPVAPSSFQLRSDFSTLLQNKMISDTVVLHPGKIKVLFGPKANSELRADIKVIRSPASSLTNNQIKTNIVDTVREFFDIRKWEFGETFFFSELAAFIHSRLVSVVDSVVLVPTSNANTFGDLYQVFAKEDEILQPDISVNEVKIVESLNPRTLERRL